MIRIAERADLPILHELIRELAGYEKLEHDCFGTREDLDRFLFGEKPFATAYLAFEDGQPAGFALYFFTFSTFAAKPVMYLEDIFVKPEFRGRGIGGQLFNCLLEVAQDSGCARVEWSVLDWNQPAIRFYESLGAECRREWIKYALKPAQIEALLQQNASRSGRARANDRANTGCAER